MLPVGVLFFLGPLFCASTAAELNVQIYATKTPTYTNQKEEEEEQQHTPKKPKNSSPTCLILGPINFLLFVCIEVEEGEGEETTAAIAHAARPDPLDTLRMRKRKGEKKEDTRTAVKQLK